MSEKKRVDALMDKATDQSADALRGVAYQDSGKTTAAFNKQIDKAAEQASAKAKKT